jgi:hypothetical protein
MQRDVWGGDIRLQIFPTADGVSYRYLSAGANGIWENGLGDDLYVELSLTKDRKLRIVTRPLHSM